jgi:ribulose-phosphate 3-epimerase
MVDLVLVMTVNPGFGGQSFIGGALETVSRVRAMTAGRAIDIEVDGGIGPETVRRAAAAGANVFVAGNAVFREGPEHYARHIAAIRAGAAEAGGSALSC